MYVIIVDTWGYTAQLQQEEISQQNLLEQALITPLFKKQGKKMIENSIKLPDFAAIRPDLNILIVCLPPTFSYCFPPEVLF